MGRPPGTNKTPL
jgi:DNA invertase Pin-like site-specific DNA recombinase